MSEPTLFSFLLVGARKDNSTNLPDLFIRGVTQILEVESLTEVQIASALGNDGVLTLSKAVNRTSITYMNHLTAVYKQKVNSGDDERYHDEWDLITSTNRMPQRTLGWKTPIELVRELVD